MKLLGYIIQLLCIIGLLKGSYSQEYQFPVYIICFLGCINLVYNIVHDFIEKKVNNRKSN